MQKAARWLIAALVVAVLAPALVMAGRAALAGDDVLAGRIFLKIGFTTPVPPLDYWANTRDRLGQALALEPDNPTTLELLGIMAMRRSDDPGIMREATAYYVRSLQLRPVAPVTWANLAEARYLEGDTGPLFEHSLQYAARLGPSEPQAQRFVSLYGLAVYDEVRPETRSAIEAMVGAGMRRAPGEILSIAHRRGRLDVACRYLPDTRRKVDPRWQQLCTPK